MIQVEGRNPVKEALKTTRPEKIYIAENMKNQEKIDEIMNQAGIFRIPIEIVSKRFLDSLSKSRHHQGIIAIVPLPEKIKLIDVLSKNEQDITLIIIVNLYDPMNLGSIIRTAVATGVDAIIISKKGSIGLTPSVIRASMGGAFHIPLIRENLYQAVKTLKKEGVKIVGVDLSGTQDHFNERLSGPIAIILGGEDKGINQTLLKKCDAIVRIPIQEKMSSLNVGVAAAVVLYEIVRQKLKV
jgi:23S rRNA (guanosine2251-2'-O)-methyltransferase